MRNPHRLSVQLAARSMKSLPRYIENRSIEAWPRLFVQKELDVLGSRNAQPEDFEAIIKLLEARMFSIDHAVRATVPLEQAADALSSWSENPSRCRKIMVCMD